MAIDVKNVAKVYLTNPEINRRSMIHTAYCADPADQNKMFQLLFVGGIARNVPLALYERFKAAGVVTTDRPRRPRTTDDDEDC